MSVKLRWATPNIDNEIAYNARQSSNYQDNPEHMRLFNTCVRDGHWSVFEMANICVELETSRAISAQIIRHRSMTFQEFSQRYSNDIDFIKYGARAQDYKNRQNSIDNLSEENKKWFSDSLEDIQMQASFTYNECIERGIAKECARMLLPMSTRTRMAINGTVRSWIHYLTSRCHPSTQLEHRVLAMQIKDVFKELAPDTHEMLVKYGHFTD